MIRELQLLEQAAFEIKVLRRQNEIMSARLDMFDSINAMLHAQIATRSVGESPDLVWEIEKHISSTKAQMPSTNPS